MEILIVTVSACPSKYCIKMDAYKYEFRPEKMNILGL